MRGGRSAKIACVVTNQVVYLRPAAASIMDTSQVDQARRIGNLRLNNALCLGSGWLDLLLQAVIAHPVNAELFPWRKVWLENARARRHE
jgi:hypothetical protein